MSAVGQRATRALSSRVYSGMQPSGSVHLGNYLGAVRQWAQLQRDHNDVVYW